MSESAVCRTIQKIENALIKSEKFYLHGRKCLQSGGMELEIITAEATEQPVERHKKTAVALYRQEKMSRAKSNHVIAEMTTGNILSATFCAGRKHDFQLFKETGVSLPPHVLLLADAGYQGVAKIHPNSQTPAKKTKRYPLNKEQKASNQTLSRKRILIEHIFRRLKVFRILNERSEESVSGFASA